MSQKRQAGVFEKLGSRRCAILTLSQNYPPGHVIPLHFHDRDQLVYASRGVMTVHTNDGSWVVPPDRAVWIPARVAHTIHMSGAVSMRTLYFQPKLAKALLRRCCVVNVPPLLKELILRACDDAELRRTVPRHNHLVAVILDQLEAIETVPLQLPNPADPRAARVAQALRKDFSDPAPLAAVCRTAGASKRTIERLFQSETGMSLGRWRQQLKLTRGMQVLAEGEKVTTAALDAGYSTPSAFIAAFKKILGVSPKSYFQRR
jgi:AraC-like DNA-binding protein